MWMSGALRGSPMSASLVREAKALRRRSVSEVFGGRAVVGRYVAPKTLGYELPTAGWPEIAFAGRSNVGKSTLVGTLLGNARLCRRSKTPGCTTTINFFETGGPVGTYLVDLPGFGYAERADDQQADWKRVMLAYLSARDRSILRHACLLVDARRRLSPIDLEALAAFSDLQVSHHVVLVKADLAKPPDLAATLVDTFRTLHDLQARSTCLPVVHLVSSKLGWGIPQLQDYLTSFVVDALDTKRDQRRERRRALADDS